MKHPPWLRFQAFVLGLPKTGSTSLATIFANYRTGHEADMQGLLAAGLPWRAGEISEEQFWALTTPRLTRPGLEMDSATCHHLYARLLIERFPRAVFIHSARDVGGWLTSLLDMAQRYRFARQMLGMQYSEVEIRYMASMTDGKLDPQQDGRARDREAVIPMMRYWAQHMRDIADVLPAGRSLLIRTGDITGRMDELAAVCGVPRQTLRDDLSHANRAPHTLDRLALYDDPQIREAYRVHCADIMADVFPEAHERVFLVPASGLDWEAHCDAAHAWVSEAVQKYGEAVGR